MFKLLALLFAAPLLQKVVILTYHDGSVSLSGGHTLRAQRTASTMVTPFEAITNFLTLGFLFARPRLEPRTNALKGRLSAFIKRYSSGSYAYPISGCSICCSLRLFFCSFSSVSGETTFSALERINGGHSKIDRKACLCFSRVREHRRARDRDP